MLKTILIACIFICFSCNNDPRAQIPETGSFGNKIEQKKPTTVEEALKNKDSIIRSSKQIQISGIIDNYCKGEGCWLSLKNENGKPLLADIENKGFILPRNIQGKTAIVQGNLVNDSSDGNLETIFIANGIEIK